MNKYLLKRNKELEVIFGVHNDNEVILNNYKSKLEKNNEIDNSITKCKEFKGNLDQYEKDKEIKAKEFLNEKEVLLSEVEDKSKKLEVTLRELNEISIKEGNEEGK